MRATVMQAADAARLFHDWAATEGLMPEGPAATVSSTPGERAAVAPLTDAGKQVLRRRAVLGVMFSEAEREVVVLTRLAKPTKKEVAVLPDHVDDVAVTYRQGAPSPIG